jgi:septal ring factor EnvC (AmiA/AmiB activator)
MADMERRMSSIEDHMAHVVTTLDILATNQNRLDEALSTLAESHIRLHEAQIRTQQQMAETDRRISDLGAETDRRIANLTVAIGELIRKMDSSVN